MNIGHISFEINCGYQPYIFFGDKTDSWLKSCLANKLVKKLKELSLFINKPFFTLKNFKSKPMIRV